MREKKCEKRQQKTKEGKAIEILSQEKTRKDWTRKVRKKGKMTKQNNKSKEDKIK